MNFFDFPQWATDKLSSQPKPMIPALTLEQAVEAQQKAAEPLHDNYAHATRIMREQTAEWEKSIETSKERINADYSAEFEGRCIGGDVTVECNPPIPPKRKGWPKGKPRGLKQRVNPNP